MGSRLVARFFPEGVKLFELFGDGRKYPEANARIVRLTYDTWVMKGSLDDTNASITPGR